MENNEQSDLESVVDSINSTFEDNYNKLDSDGKAVVDSLSEAIEELIVEFGLSSYLLAMHRVVNRGEDG